MIIYSESVLMACEHVTQERDPIGEIMQSQRHDLNTGGAGPSSTALWNDWKARRRLRGRWARTGPTRFPARRPDGALRPGESRGPLQGRRRGVEIRA